MNTKSYFENIGAWPREESSLFGAYVAGFAFSLALTFVGYVASVDHVLPRTPLYFVLGALAIAQFVAQVILFLHIGSRKASRERLIIFLWACMIVCILVGGSLWIMISLSPRMMSQYQMQEYMQSEGGF